MCVYTVTYTVMQVLYLSVVHLHDHISETKSGDICVTWMCKFCAPDPYCRRGQGGSVLLSGADCYPLPALPPLSRGFCARHLLSCEAPLCRFPDMIVNSARVFVPIWDLSVTVKTGDISGDSSSRGQDTENGDCPRKPGTSGHPIIYSI